MTTELIEKQSCAHNAGLHLRTAELLVFIIFACIASASIALHTFAGRTVEWDRVTMPIVISLSISVLGLAIRSRGSRFERYGTGAVALGIFGASITLNSIFALQLLPLSNPTIDARLIALDARLGYDWAAFVEFIAQSPASGRSLAVVYNSFLYQMLVVICVLAIMGRFRQLHGFLFLSQATLLITLAFWWFYPSFGPAAYVTVPREIEDSIRLIYNSEAGRILRTFAEIGPETINMDIVIGVVAFPSYHMIMACIVVWFLRGTPLFAPALFVNIAMVPATLSRGGHHLVDLIAGVALFCVAIATMKLVLRRGGVIAVS